MNFELHPAPPALANSVKAIWFARGTKDEFGAPEPIVPDGCVEIIFNLGDPFIHAATGAIQPRDLIAGQMTRPVVALPTGDVDLIGVRLRTSRAGAALRLPMSALQDQFIAAADVARGLGRVIEPLRKVAPVDRLAHLTRTLSNCFGPIDADSLGAVDHAVAIIDATCGAMPIDRIARMVGVTRRHLERQFREHVGLGAKHLARIARVHTALDLLKRLPDLSGAEIAAACGYSDQSHLIRECQQLAGRTPLSLKTTQRSLASHLYRPTRIRTAGTEKRYPPERAR